MRFFFFAFFFLLLALPARAVIVDRIVAVVNDEVITLSELDEAAAPLYKRYLAGVKNPVERDRLINEIRRKVLREMIDDLLVAQEVERLGITVTDEEIDHFIENVKQQNGLSDEQLEEMVRAQGLTMEEYRKRIADQIKRIKLIQTQVRGRLVITEEELRDYYQKHYLSSGQTKYELAAIIIRGEDAEEKARKAYEELRSGADFVEVARKYSVLPDSGKGLGTFSLEELSPEVREVIRGLKPGEFSRPVKVGDTWQIFLVIAVHAEGAKSFEEAKPEIQQKLYQEKVDQLFQNWLKELREKSYVRILL
ncbi:MAG: hypothetical protein GXO17_03510 [Thermodesulfobacteria bacterium]|nr:hypothetical protein [Thermodesulfobacteriota bacterium]